MGVGLRLHTRQFHNDDQMEQHILMHRISPSRISWLLGYDTHILIKLSGILFFMFHRPRCQRNRPYYHVPMIKRCAPGSNFSTHRLKHLLIFLASLFAPRPIWCVSLFSRSLGLTRYCVYSIPLISHCGAPYLGAATSRASSHARKNRQIYFTYFGFKNITNVICFPLTLCINNWCYD